MQYATYVQHHLRGKGKDGENRAWPGGFRCGRTQQGPQEPELQDHGQ